MSWLFLLFSAVAMVVLFIGLPMIQESVSIAENITPDFTDNVTHWSGFSEITSAAPFIFIIMLVFMIAVGWWRLHNRGN